MEKLTQKEHAELKEVRLSKEEFASFMKLKTSSLFVDQIFSVTDADGDETINFCELRDVIILFTKGSLARRGFYVYVAQLLCKLIP